VGEATLVHEAAALAPGAEAIAFARPHELSILTDPDSAEGIAARVARVLALGANVRVELDGLASDPDGGTPIHYEVVLPRDQVQTLGLVAGQRVRLVPARLRVFAHRAA